MFNRLLRPAMNRIGLLCVVAMALAGAVVPSTAFAAPVEIGGVDTGVDVVALITETVTQWGIVLLILVAFAFGLLVIGMAVRKYGKFASKG